MLRPPRESDSISGLVNQDDVDALRWFADHLPRCMKLVPVARRDAFLRGFRLALSEDEVDITLD